ncbi:MAG: hypothetical protein MUC79_13175 [Thiobacillaceae bacterium]|jgi:hypothetical protein|nr:hypothetical protein [Thiobacillaceae bacterium]
MSISGFTQADLALVRATLKERFGHDVDVQEVDTEVRLSDADRELTACPALYWKEEDCAFVVAKAGEAAYRAMFFYSVKYRYGTGREEYDNLGDCVITLLKVQEDVARERAEETGNP